MELAISKAEVLIEALPYILTFRSRVVVIKVGGRAMADPAGLVNTLQDVAFLAGVGIHPIVVHGGGPFISEEMKRRGKSPQFIQGLRVTDADTLSIAFAVTQEINERIVAGIREHGGQAEGFHFQSSLCVTAERQPPRKVDGKGVDLGLVGRVVRVNIGLLRGLCEAHVVPVIAPQSRSLEGSLLNVNADEVAARVAQQMLAEKLVLLTDTHGVMREAGDESSLASSLHEDEVEELMGKGVITAGMLPKVKACLEAVKSGVRKAHIIDGRISHSLLLEIFTRKGIGTEIVA